MSRKRKNNKQVDNKSTKIKEEIIETKKIYNEEEFNKAIKNSDPNSIMKAFLISDEGVESKQLKDEWADLEIEDAVVPPYDPETWAEYLELSSSLRSSIDSLALNTVGLGWNTIRNKKFDRSFDEKEEKAFQKEKQILDELFEFPNQEMPFLTVTTRIKTDEEATGNGYMEVARNRKNKIKALYHVPSHTMRVRKNGGFIQLRNGVIRYFKDFGDERIIDAETGYENKNIPFEERANEIIHFKLYCPRDSFYGIPRHASAQYAIEGNYNAAEYNASFFKNAATPRYIILCDGTNIDKESIEHVKQFFQASGKGPKNAHRCLILQTSKKSFAGPSQADKGHIKLEPVTIGKTDDASHLNYQKKNDEEIRSVHRIPSILLGILEDANRATALTAIGIVNQQVFLPEQVRYEYIINHTLVKDFGFKYAKFEFVDLESTDPVEKAEIDEIYAKAGTLSIDEIRSSIKKQPFNKTWSKIPFEVLKIYLTSQRDAELKENENMKDDDVKKIADIRKKIIKSLRKVNKDLQKDLKDKNIDDLFI